MPLSTLDKINQTFLLIIYKLVCAEGYFPKVDWNLAYSTSQKLMRNALPAGK